MTGFLRRKIIDPLRVQLRQGVSPEALARACVLGAVGGTFPFLGTTTVLCATAAAALRLNQPAVQAANYAVSGFQLLLIPVLLRAGGALFHVEPVAVNPLKLPGLFWADPPGFLRLYGRAGLAAAALWALAAPAVAAVIYFPLRRGFRKMAGLLGNRAASGT